MSTAPAETIADLLARFRVGMRVRIHADNPQHAQQGRVGVVLRTGWHTPWKQPPPARWGEPEKPRNPDWPWIEVGFEEPYIRCGGEPFGTWTRTTRLAPHEVEPIDQETIVENRVVALDVETTGLSPERDELVEIGAVRCEETGRVLGQFQRLIRPSIPIPARATAVHGITNMQVRHAPRCADVVPELLRFLGTEDMLIAHNARFDQGFLNHAIARTGDPRKLQVFCTLEMARRLRPRARSHSLKDLCAEIGIEMGSHHRALDDAVACTRLYFQLRKIEKEREIHEELRMGP